MRTISVFIASAAILTLLTVQYPATAQMRGQGGMRGQRMEAPDMNRERLMGGVPGMARGPVGAPGMIARVLEDAGYPLTEAQIEQLRSREPGVRISIEDILTAEQSAALAAVRADQEALREQRMQAQRERMPQLMDRNRVRNDPRTGMLEHISAILEEAGFQLTDAQRALIAALEPGGRSLASLADILTADQLAAIQNARPLANRNQFERPGFPGRGKGRGPAGEFGPFRDIDQSAAPETGIDGAAKEAVKPELVTGIRQNFPNPFNPTTTIEYSLATSRDVRIEIFNSAGQRIESLVNGYQEAGNHTVVWDASKQANGVYFCRLVTGHIQETRKMLFVK